MIKTRRFHIGDVLSVTTGRLVSTRHMEGIYDILNFLHQDSLLAPQLGRARRDAQPWLRESVPSLYTPEIEVLAIGELTLMLETPTGKSDTANLIRGWLSKLAVKYGDEFELTPIPRAEELHRDPIEELEEIAPGKGIAIQF